MTYSPIRFGVPPTVLVLTAIVSVQLGGAMAAMLVPVIGPGATVLLRLTVATVLLWLVARPVLGRRPPIQWAAVIAFGAALALMNLSFYMALDRLPIGVAVTVEFLGPLLLSAAGSRRWSDGVAVLAALLGVAAISKALSVPWSSLDLFGLGMAALAGAGWAAYILCSRAVGQHFQALEGLTLAMTVATIGVAPYALLTARGSIFQPWVLGLGVAVAVLSSVLPYSLELVALRRLSPTTFGILLSMEPAVAALAGWLLLQQRLTLGQFAGMGLVVAASAIIMAARRRLPQEPAAEVGG